MDTKPQDTTTDEDELAIYQWYYGATPECGCQRCRKARRKAAEDPRRKS